MQELKSILILDDEADYRRLLHNFLEKYFQNCQIDEYDPVESGAPAEDYDWAKYDVLLLDHHISLESITGLDILQKNKENPNFPATIMLTAADDEEVAFRALKLGISDFIRKQELTKTKLQTSIEEAWSTQLEKKKRQIKLLKIQKAFSKKIFYKTLQQNVESIEGIKSRILVGFRISEKETNADNIHSFVKDRIVRYIAKNSYSFFLNLNLEPHITLFSEKMAVILLDIEQDANNVIDLIKNLHQIHLDQPFKQDSKITPYNLETGILHLTQKTLSQEQLVEYFQVACDKAARSEHEGNRIYLLDADKKNVVQQEKDSIKPKIEEKNLLAIKAYDVEFDASKLDEKSKEIIDALNEKRLVQTFQPVIMLVGYENDELSENDIYSVSSQLIQQNGDDVPANKLFAELDNMEVNKYYDRWLLKETIGIIMGLDKNAASSYYILNLSHESLADTTLFNWLRQLLSGFETKQPGKQIILEFSHKDFQENQKQVAALMQYLQKSHGFRFALSHIEDVSAIKDALSSVDLNMFMLNYQIIPELKSIESETVESENFVMHLKRLNKRIIARDIQDAMALTEAISAGADFAIGEFIGMPQTSLEDESVVQSYEIEDDQYDSL